MKNVIYKIRNVVNDKFYVGSTANTETRFKDHRRKLRNGNHHCKHLQAAWNKYGEDCFKFEVIERVKDGSALWNAENAWLTQWVGRPECYNSGRSAEAPNRGLPKENNPLTGRVRPQEVNEQISRSLKDYYAENEHPSKGKKITEDQRLKCVENGKLVPRGEASPLYGVPRSDEVKAKISAKCKGLPNKMKGLKHSEQSRMNISAAVKRGEDSHFYGKPPKNLEDLKRPILAILPDRSERVFDSLSALRDEVGVAIGTTIRACTSGKPIQFGEAAGWVLSYADGKINMAPEIPEEYLSYPRTRKDAKSTGAKFYFTGIPCERGHISPRKTKGCCVECMKEDWKKENDRRKDAK